MSTIQRATKRFGFRYAYALAAAALLVTMLVSGAMAQSIIHAVDGAHGQQYVDHVSEMARKFSTETGIQVNVMTASGHREQIAVWAAGGSASGRDRHRLGQRPRLFPSGTVHGFDTVL